MFALQLIAGLLYAVSPSIVSALNCDEGRTCIYMEACNGKLEAGCPLAYSYKLEGEILSMELAGYQPSGTGRYLAIGFNEKQGMGNARVTECSAIGDETQPSVKLSWNKDGATVNLRIENEEAFRAQVISEAVGKYENGMIYCSWKQDVGKFVDAKVFQHISGVKYDQLAAYGTTSTDPAPKLNKHEGAHHMVFDYLETTLHCDEGRTCFYMEACNGELKAGCPLAYSYKLEGDILSMELAGYQPSGMGRYLAIGFNEKQSMGNARVTECSAIGDEQIPSVKLSWNKDGATVNLRIDNEEALRAQVISEAVGKYENGMIFCSWKQDVGKFVDDKVFQHISGVKYDQLAAYGTTDPAPKLNKHDGAHHMVFDYLENYSNLNCADGRFCVYMDECKGVLSEGCPLAYSYKLDGETLSMELSGYQPTSTSRYLAIGFNEVEGMANARVTECSAIGDEQIPTVKLSYNKNEGTANVRIDNENDFRDQIISDVLVTYENGLIYCRWTQKVGEFKNDQSDKVLQVKADTKYHHLVAFGTTQADPPKLDYHQKTGRQYTIYDTFEGTDDTGKGLNCDNGRTCVYMDTCKGTFDTKCPLAYSFKLDGDLLSMELVGYQKSGMNRYLAIGFGEKDGMAESKVTECSAIGDEKYPTIKLSYNTPGGESVNVRIDNEPTFRDSIIYNPISKYEDGMFYCSWKQNVSSGNDQVFQHKEGVPYHHIVAYGPTAVDATYAGLDEHEDKGSPLYRAFEDGGDDGGDPDKDGLNCDGGRTCAYMNACNGAFGTKCPLAYSFKLDGDILSLELTGYQTAGTRRYLAVGFGDKSGMANAYVTECSAIGAETAPSVKLSFNDPISNQNERIDDEPNFRASIISEAKGKYEDGKMYCSWKQNVSSGNPKVFNRKAGVNYFNIVAYGSTTDTDLAVHDDKQPTITTDFESSTQTSGDSTNQKLIKAHGSLMMIGWLIAVPIAAIFARFLRSHWPTKKPFGLAMWFHVHRTCNILACLIFIAGFVCIFIETSWQWRGVGSKSSYWIATHSTVGIIACVLAWLQPFISLLRCDPQNPRRPIFNWVHRLIGMTAFILAVTATSIASNNFSIWKTDDHLLYLILSFVPLGSVIVLFVIMTILDAKIRVHDANIVKIHAIRFTLVCIAIAVAAGAAIALVVLLILA